MSFRHTTLVLFLLSAALPGRGRAAEPVAWGDPVHGLRVGIAAALWVPSSQRQPLFTVTLENVSSETLTLPAVTAYMQKPHPEIATLRSRPLHPVVKYVAGRKALYSIGDDDARKTGPPALVALAPGRSLVLRDVPLEEYASGAEQNAGSGAARTTWWLLPESSYQISFFFENEQPSVGKKKLWTGKAASGKVSIYVAAPAFDRSKIVGAFRLAKSDYFVGEPIYVTFKVTNRGEQPIRFPTGGDYAGRPERFSFVARDQNGKTVPDPVGNSLPGGGPGGPRELKPGETYTETLLVNQWCAFPEAGSYAVAARRTLALLTAGAQSRWMPEEVFPSLPIATKLSLTLRRDDEALAAYIEDLVTRLNGKEAYKARDEIAALAQTRSEALFPALEKLVRNPGPHRADAVRWITSFGMSRAGPVLQLASKPAGKTTVTKTADTKPSDSSKPPGMMGVLAPWKVESALTPVQKALLSDDPNERSSAVMLCSLHLYPECFPTLLTMADDNDRMVRRYLGAALGAYGDKQAVPVLLKLLHDYDYFIKIWAASGLGDLGRKDGIPVLIDLLRREETKGYRGQILVLLRQLAGHDSGDDYAAWRAWWEREGKAKHKAKQ